MTEFLVPIHGFEKFLLFLITVNELLTLIMLQNFSIFSISESWNPEIKGLGLIGRGALIRENTVL